MAETAADEKGAVVFSDRPEPKPAVMNTGSIVNARGQKLFTSSWLPFQGDAKAILLYHHGLSEHSGRYEHAFAKLAAAGIAVYSYDAFSQGKSEPKETQLRSYIDDFQHLLDDYMLVLKSIRDEYEKQSKPLPPVFAGGGSLGGLVVALVAVKHPNEFAGLVMQSPCVDVEWTPFLRMQAKMGGYLNYFFPKAALVPAVRPEDMSQDPKVVKEYLDDPLIYTGKVKVRTAHLTLQAMGQLQKEIPKLTLPLYICHGTMDRCTSCPASKRLFEAAPTKDKVFHAIEGGYHELLFGPEKADCLDKMITWLLDHYPGATPVAATFPTPAAPTTTPAAAPPTTTTPAAAPAAASTTTTTPAAADAASVPAAAVTGATPGADSSAAIAATAAAIERATSQAIEGMKTTEADAPKA